MEKKKSHMKAESDINENKVNLILDLRKNGIDSPEILRVIEEIDRSYFVDSHLYDKSNLNTCLLYTSPSPRDRTRSRMPSSA